MLSQNPILIGLRCVSLLRVSSKKQVSFKDGAKDDIPVQREIVNEFIELNEMVLIREFVEPGISASKVPLAKREALLEIFRMADRKEFDVLVVFKHDRISRIQHEYPFILSYLNQRGVLIFTAVDGQEKKSAERKGATPEEGLQCSIDGYSASKESSNLRDRVTSGHRVIIRQGQYRGGAVPFGYKTEYIGETNQKGKPIQSIVIDEEKAEVVRMIFNMVIEKYMGVRTITKWLNENGYDKYLDNGGKWSYPSVRFMLHNKMYKGYLHFSPKNDDRTFYSDKIDELEIIDEVTWDATQKALESRIRSKGGLDRTVTLSNALLSGYIYCGHCGSKLHVWSNQKSYQIKDGSKKKYIVYRYRCSSKTLGKECDGATTYGVNRIDDTVIKATKEYIARQSNKGFRSDFIDDFTQRQEKLKIQRKEKEVEAEKKQKQIIALKKEIPNALIGESAWSQKELKEALTQCEDELQNILRDINTIAREETSIECERGRLVKVASTVKTWNSRFQDADFTERRALLDEVIESVTVYKDGIDITFKVEMQMLDEKGCVVGSVGTPS